MLATLTDMVLDAVQNSIEAGSSLIILDWREEDNFLDIYISDNGKGMDEQTLRNALDPFYTDGEKHPHRKVGLGLPFIKQACEQMGGKFDIDSRAGEGTSVHIRADLSSVDCPPLGNLASLFAEVMLFDGKYEMVINRYLSTVKKYTLLRSELADALLNLNETESIVLLKRYIQEQEEHS